MIAMQITLMPVKQNYLVNAVPAKTNNTNQNLVNFNNVFTTFNEEVT